MEESSSHRRTFTVGLKPAHQLLRGLMVTTGIASSAVLIVKNGEIQISSTSRDLDAYGSLMMEASTAASWTSECYAIQFDPAVWIQLFRSSMDQQSTEWLWIYKIGRYPDLYCLVGNDSNPKKLGEARFVEEDGIDMKKLDSHHVRVHLRTRCLREVMLSFTPRYQHVMMMAMDNRVSWRTAAGELTHHAENADCLIEGVEPGTASYLLLEWRHPRFLNFASWLSEDVLICTLVDPNWMDWILFSFLIDQDNSFFYMMPGSDIMIVDMQEFK